MRLAVITPLFHEEISGASVYYKLLSECLAERSCIDHVYIFSQKSHAEIVKSNISYFGIFPQRSDIQKKSKVRRYLLYALQNLFYFRLLIYIPRLKPDIVLVHSSFYNYPNLFFLIPFLLKTKFILDVRDPLLSNKKFWQLHPYDYINTCSEDLSTKYSQFHTKMCMIPVIHQIKKDFKNSIKPKEKFILYIGIVSKSKGVDKLIRAYNIIAEQGHSVRLKIVGFPKDQDIIKMINGKKGISYQSNVSNDNARRLISKASIVVNLSKDEGFPRVCLEAIEYKTPFLLRREISELVETCPKNILKNSSDKYIAKKILEIMDNNICCNYKLDNHRVSYVINKYIDLFEKIKES